MMGLLAVAKLDKFFNKVIQGYNQASGCTNADSIYLPVLLVGQAGQNSFY